MSVEFERCAIDEIDCCQVITTLLLKLLLRISVRNRDWDSLEGRRRQEIPVTSNLIEIVVERPPGMLATDPYDAILC